jgi:hypothetical protein
MPVKSAPAKPSSAKTASKKPASRRAAAKDAKPDPTTDEALLGLDPSYAAAPDIPMSVAIDEMASLARLGKARQKELAKVGIDAAKIGTLARFAARLKKLETAWQHARSSVRLTAGDREMRKEAEALDTKLLAGGRWACRNDEAAQTELSRIAEGASLSDTVQDLRDLVAFWRGHKTERSQTKITREDLARAVELANELEPAAANEENDAVAAEAIELRNRCFWAGDAVAKEIREGGRYAFDTHPKIAAKFVSRYRATLTRRSRRKAKANKSAGEPGAAQQRDS